MKIVNNFRSIILSFLAIGIISGGCEVTDTPVNDAGQLVVKLTDAPGDFDAVYIDIKRVQVKPDNFYNEGNDTAKDKWITLGDNPTRVDLLKLRNGNTVKLGTEDLDAGYYNQIRLVLGTNNEVVINGESIPLTTPSSQQSGLKLDIDMEIHGGKSYTLLVDFDAGRSIVQTESNSYFLKPTLRAVELNETGTIAGAIEPVDIQTSVLAVANNDTLSTLTDNDGNFEIIGVPGGTYNVIFQPKSNTYAGTTQNDVEVKMKEKVDLGTITLEKQ